MDKNISILKYLHTCKQQLRVQSSEEKLQVQQVVLQTAWCLAQARTMSSVRDATYVGHCLDITTMVLHISCQCTENSLMTLCAHKSLFCLLRPWAEATFKHNTWLNSFTFLPHIPHCFAWVWIEFTVFSAFLYCGASRYTIGAVMSPRIMSALQTHWASPLSIHNTEDETLMLLKWWLSWNKMPYYGITSTAMTKLKYDAWSWNHIYRDSRVELFYLSRRKLKVPSSLHISTYCICLVVESHLKWWLRYHMWSWNLI